MEKFKNEEFIVKQAPDDADTLIVTMAIEIASSNQVVIVGEGIELFVLLTALAPPESNIYFVKPGKGKTDRKVYYSQSSITRRT